MGRFDGARGVARARSIRGRSARACSGGRGPAAEARTRARTKIWRSCRSCSRRRALAPVPLVFESALQFCHLIGNNLLAEFWHLVQEGPRGPAIRAQPAGDGKLSLVPDAGSEGGESLVHHLLLINRNSLHLVVAQSGGNLRDAATGERAPIVLSLKPKLTGFQGPIRSSKYVGSFVAEPPRAGAAARLRRRRAQPRAPRRARPEGGRPGALAPAAAPGGGLRTVSE